MSKAKDKGTQDTEALATAAPAADVQALMAQVKALQEQLAKATATAAAKPSKAPPEPVVMGLPDTAPKFKQAPRYKLLKPAFMSGILIQHGNDWIPFDDVLLDPDTQPFVNQLSGPFGGRGDAERQPINIEFKGIPGEHLEPLNEAAEWMFDHIDELKERAMKMASERRRARRSRDPIESLTVIGPHATVLENTGA